jgi:hypothetical protein
MAARRAGRSRESEPHQGRKVQTAAPGPYLGYSLQATRLLQLLLDAAAGTTVSLEVFEDVGEERPDKTKRAVQTKSITGSANPVSDRAVGLWKTLANWVKAVQAGTLLVGSTVFEIYVSKPCSGSLVQGLSDATTSEQATSILDSASKALLNAEHISPELLSYVRIVFNAEERIRIGIAVGFKFTSGSGSPQADVRNQLMSKLVPPEILDLVLDHAIGWLKRKTDLCLEKSLPAFVRRDEFYTELTSFIRKCTLRGILAGVAGKPSTEELKEQLMRTYVRQLEIIEADEEDIFVAVNDFMRASVDRTEWSRVGLINETSLDDFEAALITFWRNKKKQHALTNSELGHNIQGQLLYRECSTHRRSLEGLEVPDYFTPGSFHSLADILEVGWHPEYKIKVRQD